MIRINSSNISGAQVDGDTLLIQFRRDGSVYSYQCQDEETALRHFDEIQSVESPGRYFAKEIRPLPTKKENI